MKQLSVDARRALDNLREVFGDYEDRIVEVRKRRGKAIAALLKYGGHLEACELQRVPTAVCTCGYQAVLDEFDPARLFRTKTHIEASGGFDPPELRD